MTTLHMQQSIQYNYSYLPDVVFSINYQSMEAGADATQSLSAQIGTLNPSATPFALFPDIDTALAYYQDSQITNIINTINSNVGTTFFTDYQVITMPQYRTFTNPSRTLNSAFQIHKTREVIVSYSVNILAALSLTSGQTGTVTLQYADDSGFTTNVKTVQSGVNGNTGTLTLGLGLNQTSTGTLTGVIPSGKYVKIVTANTAGAPSFSLTNTQEFIM